MCFPTGITSHTPTNFPLRLILHAITGNRMWCLVTLHLDMSVLMQWCRRWQALTSLARVGMVKTRTQRSEQAFNRVNVPAA